MFYGASAGVKTISGADTWIPALATADQMPVCLILASTKDAYKVEVSDDGGSTWTTIADLASESGDTVVDWMFYNTNKATLVKTTGTGFMRVQGNLVAA
jgi:hypothetical protein